MSRRPGTLRYITHSIPSTDSLAKAWQTIRSELLRCIAPSPNNRHQPLAGSFRVGHASLFIALSPEDAEQWLEEVRALVGPRPAGQRPPQDEDGLSVPNTQRVRKRKTDARAEDIQGPREEEEEEEEGEEQGQTHPALGPRGDSRRGRGRAGTPQVDETTTTVVVTNRNRKKAQQQDRQQIQRLMGRFDHTNAADEEVAIWYRQHAATLKWISLQENRPRDPQKVYVMLRNAENLGSLSARCTLRSVLEDWRAFAGEHIASQVSYAEPNDISSPHEQEIITELCAQMAEVRGLDQTIKLSAVNRRVLLADIATSVRRAEAIETSYSPAYSTGRRGVGRMTVVKEQLYRRLYNHARPNIHSAAFIESEAAIGDGVICSTQPDRNVQGSRAWKQMGDWIAHGKHWLVLREAFGDGFFALIPRDVPDSWIERMDLGGLQTFAALVKRLHPWIEELSTTMQPHVARILSGAAPPPTLLPIERLTSGDLATLEGWQLTALVTAVEAASGSTG